MNCMSSEELKKAGMLADIHIQVHGDGSIFRVVSGDSKSIVDALAVVFVGLLLQYKKEECDNEQVFEELIGMISVIFGTLVSTNEEKEKSSAE